MRTLSTELEAAQKSNAAGVTSMLALVKLVLTKSGETTQALTGSHIHWIEHSERPDSQTATIVLDNTGGAYNTDTLDLRGYKGVISGGAKTTITDSAWVKDTVYAVGTIVIPTTANGYRYICSTTGTSASTEPTTWTATLGAVISDGTTLKWTCEGETSHEYSKTVPLTVVAQRLDSWPTGLICVLSLAGLPNLLNEDKASVRYTQETGDTNTVKDLFRQVAGDTSVTHLACYNHCSTYDVTFDSEDALIDVFTPQEAFYIGANESRLAVLKRLLSYTKCSMRFENDGADNAEIHVFVPTVDTVTDWVAATDYVVGDVVTATTDDDANASTHYVYRCTTAGTSHASTEPTWPTDIGDTVTDGTAPTQITWTVGREYEYTLVAAGHFFEKKAVRKRLVIPNYIVVSSYEDDEDSYTGYAEDTDSSDLREIRDHNFMRLTSNAQATLIATAILRNHQLDAQNGDGLVPMNVGQEVMDFVKIIDSREDDSVSGTIGWITRTYQPGEWTMEFGFGSGVERSLAGTIIGAGAEGGATELDPVAIIEKLAWIQDALRDHEVRIRALESPWRTLFDGSTETPTATTWDLEASLPFTTSGTVHFSPIIEEVTNEFVVYVLDRDQNFYKYSLSRKDWYKLASPNYNCRSQGPVNRGLALNPLGTQLASISESSGLFWEGGRRIEIYDIASDTWTASSRCQNMDDENSVSQATGMSSLVWADNNTIWTWAHKHSAAGPTYARCIKYTISTDTFTISPAMIYGLTYAEAYCAAINAAGTIIYGGRIGVLARGYFRYLIANDHYYFEDSLASGASFAIASDSDKLWYMKSPDYRMGYLDTADDSENDDQFPQNTEPGASYTYVCGLLDDGSHIISDCRSTAPELMSALSGGGYLLGTLTVAQKAEVIIEKDPDNFEVTMIETGGTRDSISTDESQVIWLLSGTWKFYYPVAGDYTRVKISYKS